ncbi:arsenate reductase ArsC [Bauldia sp.]|uniref:arsenate reductase ArsC n=1 Tax=Bauldia sp. TaxID=2575872 RepID=UPI003BAC32B0
MNDDRMLNVLFLCTGNSARSIMAEAILGREGIGKFRAFSAGSEPKGAVNPHAATLLKDLNYSIDRFSSKSWEEFMGPDAPQMDFVFTVCDDAAETCPVFPGQPMSAHWGIPDPAAATGSPAEVAFAFSEAYRMMNARISAFVNLPLAALDRLSLQARLGEIGQLKGATEKARGQ